LDAYSRAINDFVEDTCVIVVVAYLLTRGRMLALLFQERLTGQKVVWLGLILGAVGLTEIAFPGARFPYVTDTLIVTFAAVNRGLGVSLITASVVACGAAIFQTRQVVAGVIPALATSALLGGVVRRLLGRHSRLVGALAAGMLAQAGTLIASVGVGGVSHHRSAISYALLSIPANGFGVMLLQLVAGDALVRANSERHRLEAERVRALLAEAELAALRARIRPHFLCNTLTSIAALCGIAPERAEAAIVRLSHLMRRVLEVNPAAPLTVEEELEATKAYLQIEQERIGPRLQVEWRVDRSAGGVLVPAFAVQTLVENAVSHGIAPKLGPGGVTVVVRRYPRHTLVAVVDDGVGMRVEECRTTTGSDRPGLHGLQILTQQLILLYGRAARLRVFSRPDEGTVALFIVPMPELASRRWHGAFHDRTHR
jgi:histidine kinase/histidine kinase/DNA gyrase B/HSP90-like ATPase